MQTFYDNDGKRLGGIDEAVIRRCPYRLLRFEHYRPDGTCRCDDPTHLEMLRVALQVGTRAVVFRRLYGAAFIRLAV